MPRRSPKPLDPASPEGRAAAEALTDVLADLEIAVAERRLAAAQPQPVPATTPGRPEAA